MAATSVVRLHQHHQSEGHEVTKLSLPALKLIVHQTWTSPTTTGCATPSTRGGSTRAETPRLVGTPTATGPRGKQQQSQLIKSTPAVQQFLPATPPLPSCHTPPTPGTPNTPIPVIMLSCNTKESRCTTTRTRRQGSSWKQHTPLTPKETELTLPQGPITDDFMTSLRTLLTNKCVPATPQAVTGLSIASMRGLIRRAQVSLLGQPNIVHLDSLGDEVKVVGDLHGQYHDLLQVLDQVGFPKPAVPVVFLGDYIDRGMHGVETLTLLLAWHLAYPDRVVLLRGDHETAAVATAEGFEKEVNAKYPSCNLTEVLFTLFSALPVACVVNNQTLLVHAGMWREPRQDGRLMPGSLDDLDSLDRFTVDPKAPQLVDALWSDPMIMVRGVMENYRRCHRGLLFGPDWTREFLQRNNLSLVIRSHEGYDSRKFQRGSDMSMGFSVDHGSPLGKLVTIFSAPGFPIPTTHYGVAGVQYALAKGAIAVIPPTTNSEVSFTQFTASQIPGTPRPQL